jgi:hypothetical protein
MAYGIISSKAIERKRVPEKVMAIDMMLPSLKHLRREINFPKMTTSIKNIDIRINLIMRVVSILKT